MGKVKIKICVGVKPSRKLTSGFGVYGDIAHLHNAQIFVNPEKTWLAAIQKHFGIGLNPEAFIIQRHPYRKAKQFPQRSLKERIDELISQDFRCIQTKAVFGVEIISLLKNEPAILSNTTSDKSFPAEKSLERCYIPVELTSSAQKAKGLGALYIFKSAGVVLDNEDLSHELSPLHGKLFRVKDPAMTLLDIFLTHFGVDLDPERYFARHYVYKSRAAVKEHDLRESIFLKSSQTRHTNTILIAERLNMPKLSREKSLFPAGAIPTTNGCAPRAQRNVKRKLQFQVPELNKVGDSESAVYDFISTDDESTGTLIKFKEVYENEANETQNDEPLPGKRNCYRKEKPDNNLIQYEDIREEVYNLATKFTNSQLLKARDEILRLKEMSQRSEARDPWSNWNTTCPLPAAILRDLFDV